MKTTFDMVAKTFQGLEGVLADELRALGAEDVTPGVRMVSFRGDKAMLYKANFCCRTALRILKPFYSFDATDADQLYDKVKEYDWTRLLTVDGTFSIDTVAHSEEFRHSKFVTYRVKDAIVDRFRDSDPDGRRPSVRLEGADVMINVHINGRHVTLSLDSSGESLHRRGWRRAQTEAPINEVLAAGIILLSGWKADVPFVDPMCGSGTFVIEAAMMAAGIYPGIYRKHFAFEDWPDFDRELFEEIYNDESAERPVTVPIIGTDLSPRALDISLENAKSAGVDRYITLEVRNINRWERAPQPAGVLVTNPPYGKRIGSDDMNALYSSIGKTFKHVFTGYHCWVIGYDDEYFREIGLAPSQKFAIDNGGLACELREYVIFEGRKADFRAAGGAIKAERPEGAPAGSSRPRRDRDDRRDREERRDRHAPRDREERRPFRERDKDRDKDRPARRRDDDRRASYADETRPQRTGRRPLRLDLMGKGPQLGIDKEVPIARPAWRVRKKKD